MASDHPTSDPAGFPPEHLAGGDANAGAGAHNNLRAANIARQKEWDQDGVIDLAYRGNELAGECGEACNVIKKLERERRGIRGSRATVQDLADELADIVICADLVAMGEGIDLLGEAVPRKFNATSEKVGLTTRLSTTPASFREGIEAVVERLWRDCGLPEYFLGNGGTNHKLYEFARRCARTLSPTTGGEERAAFEFQRGELNLMRQWFNSIEDVNPKFLDEADRQLFQKIKTALAGAQP